MYVEIFSFNLSKNINCSFDLLLAIFFLNIFFLQSSVGIVCAKPRTLLKARSTALKTLLKTKNYCGL